MMAKASRSMVALYTFLLSTVFLLMILYIYFYAVGKKDWILELLRVRLFYLPMLVYVLLFSAAISVLVSFVTYFIRRAHYGKIEEKIRLLTYDNYDHPVLLKKIQHAQSDQYLGDIDEDLMKIKDKMMKMSKDLQAINSQPEMVDGESKEQILQEERHRLARELHDSVSQQLFAATMMLAALNEEIEKKEVPENFKTKLGTVASIINASQSEMRALLLHLRPVNLEGKSLQIGIEQLLKELQTKIDINLLWEIEDVHLPTGIEDHLFRIVQELLSNTLRHAKAHSLEVYLKQSDESLLLRMLDDGIGFDMGQEKVGSYGLKNIRERVSGMGGTCKIISFKNKGTSIEIKIPIVKESEEND